jgi:hypothetical protein
VNRVNFRTWWTGLAAAWLLGCAAATVQPRSANPYIQDAQPAGQQGAVVTGRGAAGVGVALGVGTAAARRAAGECYTPCVPGTACNPETGLCDELPCRGQCKPSERCDASGLFPRCVDDGSRMSIQPPDAGTP